MDLFEIQKNLFCGECAAGNVGPSHLTDHNDRPFRISVLCRTIRKVFG